MISPVQSRDREGSPEYKDRETYLETGQSRGCGSLGKCPAGMAKFT